MKLSFLFLLPLCTIVAEEAPPFVQNAPERAPKQKQTLKVSQNQALVTLSTDLGKEARPSQILAQKSEKKEKAAPVEKKTPRFSLTADFLYLKAKNEDLFFARRITSAGNSHVLRIDPGYTPGFWIAAAAKLPCDQWGLQLDWMRLFSEKSSHHSAQAGTLVHPSITSPVGSPVASSVQTKWHQHLNLMDLTLSRTLLATRHLKFAPAFGLRGALVDQKLQAHFHNTTYTPPQTGESLLATLKNDFKGLGLIAALDSSWLLGRGWHLFADAAFSLLVSGIDVNQHEERGSGAINHVRDHLHSVTPIFDLAAGFGWKKKFKEGRVLADLYGGWQEQLWIHQTEFQLSNGSLEKGNLSLSGFFVGARCAF